MVAVVVVAGACTFGGLTKTNGCGEGLGALRFVVGVVVVTGLAGAEAVATDPGGGLTNTKGTGVGLGALRFVVRVVFGATKAVASATRSGGGFTNTKGCGAALGALATGFAGADATATGAGFAAGAMVAAGAESVFDIGGLATASTCAGRDEAEADGATVI